MMKEHKCSVFISRTQYYGNNAWYQEYQAQIGTPLNTMYQDQGVYWRLSSKEVSIFSPCFRRAFTFFPYFALLIIFFLGKTVGPIHKLVPLFGLQLLYKCTSSPLF